VLQAFLRWKGVGKRLCHAVAAFRHCFERFEIAVNNGRSGIAKVPEMLRHFV